MADVLTTDNRRLLHGAVLKSNIDDDYLERSVTPNPSKKVDPLYEDDDEENNNNKKKSDTMGPGEGIRIQYSTTLLTKPRKSTPQSRESLLRLLATSQKKKRVIFDFGWHGIWEDLLNIYHKRVPLKPTSRLRVFWDSVIMGCIVYFFFMIPFDIAFDVSFYPWVVLDILLDFCFMFDLYLNMNTAYVAENDLVMDFKKIRRHYFRTWFFFDLIASLPFGSVVKLLQSTVPDSEAILVIKLLKVFRIFRMYHLHKAIAGMQSMKGPLLVFLIMLLFGIASHWFGCFYWRLGTMQPGYNWIENQASFPDLLHLPQSEQYIISLYWAMATITTLGYGDVTPKTLNELIYVTFVIFCGAVMYAILLSAVSTIVVSRFALESEYNQKMESLQAFSRVYHLPDEVQMKVRAYYDFIWERRKDFSETTIMEYLPFELKAEVAAAIHEKMIQRNRLLHSCDSFGFKHMFANYLSPIVLRLPDQVLYFEGDAITELVFVRRGAVDVVVGLDTVEELVVGTRGDGAHVGDLGLFNDPPIHLVSGVTVYFSEVCSITVENLNKMFEIFPEQKLMFKKVALAREAAIEKLLQEFDELAAGQGSDTRETKAGTFEFPSMKQVESLQNLFMGRVTHQDASDNDANFFWKLYDSTISPEADEALLEQQVAMHGLIDEENMNVDSMDDENENSHLSNNEERRASQLSAEKEAIAGKSRIQKRQSSQSAEVWLEASGGGGGPTSPKLAGSGALFGKPGGSAVVDKNENVMLLLSEIVERLKNVESELVANRKQQQPVESNNNGTNPFVV